jgi:hypothetical protein
LSKEKTMSDGIYDLFTKKESLYIIKVFGLSVILFYVSGGTSYILSLIASVLIINGYNNVKKENQQ